MSERANGISLKTRERLLYLISPLALPPMEMAVCVRGSEPRLHKTVM